MSGFYKGSINLCKLWMSLPTFFFIFALLPIKLEIGGVNLFLPLFVYLITLFLIRLFKNSSILYTSDFSIFLNFLFFSALSVLHASSLSTFFKGFVYLLSWFFMFFTALITANSFINPHCIIGVLRKYANVITFITLIFIVLNITHLSSRPINFLYKGTFNFNENDLGMLIIQALAIKIFVERDFKTKLISVLILILGLIFLGSRGAFLGILGALLFILIAFRNSKLFMDLVILLLLASVSIIILKMFDFQLELLNKLENFYKIYILKEETGYIDISRLIILKVNMEMIKDNFWLGVGIGDYWNKYVLYASKVSLELPIPENIIKNTLYVGRPPHNLYLRILASSGIFALVTYIFFHISALIRFTQFFYQKKSVIILSFIFYIAASMIHSFFYEGYMYPFHYLMLGWAYALYFNLVKHSKSKHYKFYKE